MAAAAAASLPHMPRVHSSHSLAVVGKRADPPPAGAPNFILMHLDDVGFGDFACNQQPGKRTVTPNIDRMAAEGVRFTSFYSSSCVCTPSRAGILTGRYPVRTSMFPRILGPDHALGLPQDEITIASWLRSKGYATMMSGKWHLGHLPPFLPEAHGFDVWTGIPYSHDFCPCPASLTHTSDNVCRDFDPPCPILNGTVIVEQPAILERLTMYYANALVEFIAKRDAARPFFAYYACHHLHHPQFAHPNLLGSSKRLGGRPDFLGDAAYEMDVAIGRILDYLRASGLERNTYVLLTSDNGAAVPYGASAGSNGILRCGKGTTWEGGQRVPAVAWGGQIAPPGRVIEEMVAGMDVFATFASLAGVDLPKDRVLDSVDFSDLLVPLRAGRRSSSSSSPFAEKRTNFIYYSLQGPVTAVRVGHLKVHFKVQPWLETKNHAPVASCHPPGIKMGMQHPVLVYNVSSDPGESRPITDLGVVREAEALAKQALESNGCHPQSLLGCDASRPMHCRTVGGNTRKKIKPWPPSIFYPWQQTGFLCCRHGHDLVVPRQEGARAYCVKMSAGCLSPPVDRGLCNPDGISPHSHEPVYCGSSPCPMAGVTMEYSSRQCGTCGTESAMDKSSPVASVSPPVSGLVDVSGPRVDLQPPISPAAPAVGADGMLTGLLVIGLLVCLLRSCASRGGAARVQDGRTRRG